MKNSRRGKTKPGPSGAKRSSNGTKRGPKQTTARAAGRDAPRRTGKAISALRPLKGKRAERRKLKIAFAMMLEGMLRDSEDGRAKLRSAIPELKAFGLNKGERKCLLAVLKAEADAMPAATGGVGMGYRIELAAAFLASLFDHSYTACNIHGIAHAEVYSDFILELAVKRAKEIWALGPA